jgi:hypothetical protein
VFFDGALCDVERSSDTRIGTAFGHKGEDLPFAGGERGKAFVAPATRKELAYYFGI